MKQLLFIAALAFGTAAAADTGPMSQPGNTGRVSGADADGRQGVRDPNARGVPPGDGIDIHGHDPEGQAFTPPGYNTGMTAYPPVAVAPPGLIGGEYPVCSARVTDRCVQAYTRRARANRR